MIITAESFNKLIIVLSATACISICCYWLGWINGIEDITNRKKGKNER